MLRLRCPVQNYAWGRPAKGEAGRTCSVGALSQPDAQVSLLPPLVAEQRHWPRLPLHTAHLLFACSAIGDARPYSSGTLKQSIDLTR